MAYIICPKCKYTVSDSTGSCTVCNYKFTKIQNTNWNFEGQQGFSQTNSDDMNEPFYISHDKLTIDDWNDNKPSRSSNPLIDRILEVLKHNTKRLLFKLSIILILTIIISIRSDLDISGAGIVFLLLLLVFSRYF